MAFECNADGVKQMAEALDNGNSSEFNRLAEEYLSLSGRKDLKYPAQGEGTAELRNRSNCIAQVADAEVANKGYDMVLKYSTRQAGYKGGGHFTNDVKLNDFDLVKRSSEQ